MTEFDPKNVKPIRLFEGEEYTVLSQDEFEQLPESTLATRIDDLLWSDCDTCRAIRLGLVIGAFIWPTLMATGLYLVLR